MGSTKMKFKNTTSISKLNEAMKSSCKGCIGVDCPICNSIFDEFLPYGRNKRPNAKCPACNSLERHRLLWLFLQQKTNFFKDKLSALEVAPTKGFSQIIQSLPNIDYTSIDLQSKNAMIRMDLTSLSFADNSFDCIICYHVLEHIPDDKKAMRELCRVLKPSGWAIIQVPILENTYQTQEDLTINSPEIRRKLYGQEDHVRCYGLDYKQRLKASGFDVKVDKFASELPPELTDLFRITLNENIYYCTKAARKTERGKGRRNVMKDVIITKNFPKLSETFILSQITGLIELGHEIEIWAQNNPNDNTVHPDIHKYNLIDKTKYLKIPDKSKVPDERWVNKFLEENKIDYLENIKLFHVHFGVTFNELKPLFMKLRQPVLVSFHGADASQYIKKYGMSYYSDLFQRADLITTPSQVMKNVLIANQCPENKINIHRYGVNLDYFKPIDNTASNIFTFLSVARLVEKKGLEYSLRAFSMLKDMQDVYYHIIGEGPLDESLQKLTKELGIQDNVSFLGSKDKSEVIRRMQQADVYVLTSVTAENGDQEGLPVTLIEAHAAGLPVISTYHAGIPELVTHKQSGFLCGEKSVSCIAKYMSILAQHSAIRTEMGKQARIRADEEFNITSLNKDLSRIYHNLVHQNCIQGNTKFSAQDNSSLPNKNCILENKGHTILYILHDGGGGTIHTTNDLTKNISKFLNCYILKMGLDYCKLFYVNSKESKLIKHYTFKNEWRVQNGIDSERKVAIYEIIDLTRPDIVHARTFICSSTHLIKLLKNLNIKVVNSFHDFHLICPTIQLVDNTYRFCGGDCNKNDKTFAIDNDCSISKKWYKETPELKNNYKHIYAESVKDDLQHCDAYIVTSDTTQKYILKNYPNLNIKKFYLIEHGRDFVHQDIDVNHTNSINNKILFFGALNYSKGCELVKQLLGFDIENKVQLHILGNINRDYHDHFKNMGAVLHGKYERNNYFEIINKINPFLTILPSIWPETFCHTLTESWSCGVPVLGSSMGAIGERISKYGGGWILDPYDPEKWYKKIISIYNDPKDYTKKKQDIQKMHFKTTKEMSDEYLDVYSDLVEANLKNSEWTQQVKGHKIYSNDNILSLDEAILLAENAMNQKAWDKAISLWQNFFATYKEQTPPESYVLYSMAHRFQGNPDQAEAVIIQGVKKFPEDIKIHAEYAQVAKARGNLKLAEKHLKISEMLNQSQPDHNPIVIIDMDKIDSFSHSDPEGVAVIMPCIDTELGLKTADILQRRAGMPCKIIIANDTLRQGFIKTANEVFKRLDVKYVVYLAQDAFPGRDWLALAYKSLEKTGKGLLAFNDGKWMGNLASFGMVRKNWIAQFYDNLLFHDEYITHSADNELSTIAKATNNYDYNPNSTLIEVDYEKDTKGFGNNNDRQNFINRCKSGFQNRIDLNIVRLIVKDYNIIL